MRAAKVLAVLAIAALGIGSFSAVAVAGKQKKKTVVSDVLTRFSHPGSCPAPPADCRPLEVSAKGSLNTVSACESSRSMRLQVLEVKGLVLTTLDRSTSDASGNWKLSGQLPTTLPAGTNYVRVKAKKRTVGKFVCQAGFSPYEAIPADLVIGDELPLGGDIAAREALEATGLRE
jgi:hypothetical protein